MVDDVVAVRAAGPGLQVRRGIGVGDAQVAQVGHDGRGVAEGEAGMELEAVRRLGPPRRAAASAACASRVSTSGLGSMEPSLGWWVVCGGWWVGGGRSRVFTSPPAARHRPRGSMMVRTCSGVAVCPLCRCSRAARTTNERSWSGYSWPSSKSRGSSLEVGRVQDAVPDVPLAGGGQREGDRLPVAVEQDQQRLADDRLAALVLVADQVAGQPHAQALDEPGVPVLVRHLLARRAEERDVLDVRAADGAAQEELPPLEDRLAPPDRRSASGRSRGTASAGRPAPSRARSARCPGSRRCCCRSACGPARRRRASSARPARASAWPSGSASAARGAR